MFSAYIDFFKELYDGKDISWMICLSVDNSQNPFQFHRSVFDEKHTQHIESVDSIYYLH